MWSIFSFSFLVALSGAISPGPLLTYTIIQSAKAKKLGYLMGLWIILGHAILEMILIIFLLLGFSFILKNLVVVRIIGTLGGIILIYFGASLIFDIYRGKISADLSTDSANKAFKNPVIGGVLVSMSNPYWWIWWATIGMSFMLQFKVSFQDPLNLMAFFLGHEAGDLAWYLLVSFLVYIGLKHLNDKIYKLVLLFCSVFMIILGLYLGISPFIS
ncbi:MAG: LysE family transporter [Desulfobacterales bacterium]|nr:LysE family transporter [Desulfobacterales bacterium]MBF0396120.1 LysE family transporter [Desulfobacterales bacterium]